MAQETPGRILAGDPAELSRSYAAWAALPVDQEMLSDDQHPYPHQQTTIGKPVSVAGPGTFFGRATRALTFEPTDEEGWWLNRADLQDSLPIEVGVSNVWTTMRNIVLCSGSPHNYVRMVEHIVALKAGLQVDNLVIRLESGDPPLFDRGSSDLVEAIDSAGIVTQPREARYVTVKEPVTIGGPGGSFLTFLPCADRRHPRIFVDCAVDFRSAIGKQRIRFDMTPASFRHGAFARTNTTLGMMMFCLTIGKLFADTRNLGYTRNNILIAAKDKYMNEARMVHAGKSLEAAWHRATLDLLAAIALVDKGRFAGGIISYKAGHTLDVVAVKKLYRNKLLAVFHPSD